eukprot:TRINITY_DN6220_c0_g3_i2.p1 TRINITY_DN6220_c0_g3~~TRINITY_DN6220_c0_g3_i2.p1  ORF type:complete len:484 (+),score=166.57 TRINITY_DN6220_c0_g3_i2:110-1561(+)
MLPLMSTSSRTDLIRRQRERACNAGVKRAQRKVTLDEVRQHNTAQDMWVIIGERVYDLSGFDSHPGGRGILEQAAGRNVTDVFVVTHPPQVQAEKERFCVGTLDVPAKSSQIMSDFHDADAVFQQRGWYQTEYGYYAKKLLVQASLFACALLPFVLDVEMGYGWATFSALMLGAFWHQLAFIGHDAGHNAVFHDRAGKDYVLSLLVTLFFGVSGQWWKKSHNVHHVVTNSVQGDPDIQHLPVFAVARKQLSSVFSLYHKKQFVFDRAAKFLVSWQHVLYIPIMCVARHNLYLQSYLMVFTDRDCRNKWVELGTLLGYAFWMAELVLRIESGSVALYWWLLSHAVCGLLHVQITLSHFSMETFDTQPDTIHRFSDDDYVRHQLATSLDVDCPEALDWVHGGLQFQVVHHLWPRLPRHRLRRARDEFLLPLCKKHGLQYHCLPFGAAVGQTLQHLKERAEEARRAPVGSVSLSGSALAQGANMIG